MLPHNWPKRIVVDSRKRERQRFLGYVLKDGGAIVFVHTETSVYIGQGLIENQIGALQIGNRKQIWAFQDLPIRIVLDFRVAFRKVFVLS
jgi:hypothetical protein